MNINPIFLVILSLFGTVGYLINNTKGCLIGLVIWLSFGILIYFINALRTES